MSRAATSALSAAALLAVALLLALAPSEASAAPSVQRTADDMAQWLRTEARLPVENRTVIVRQEVADRGHAGEYWGDGVIALAPWVADLVRMRRSSPWSAAPGIYVLLHELLHRERCGGPEEEGAVDALTIDLMPAITFRILGGWAMTHPAGYPADVHAVRKASSLAVGLPARSRPARWWRRDYWRAGCGVSGGRSAMMAAAFANPR